MSLIYNKFFYEIGNSGSNLDWNDTGLVFKLALLTGAYSPDASAHNYWSDVYTMEYPSGAANVNNYTSGGASMTATTRIINESSNGTATYNAADVTFSNLSGGIAITNAVIYKYTGTPSADVLVAHLSGSSFPKTTNGGNILVQFTNGIVFIVTGG